MTKQEILTTSTTLLSAMIEALGKAGVAVAEIDSKPLVDKAINLAIDLNRRLEDTKYSSVYDTYGVKKLNEE